MTAQERPSLGQPPHLTLPHTQCSHRNTYKDLERRPARGPRGKKSLGRRGGGRRGACPDPKLLQDKTRQPHAGQAEWREGDCPHAAPQLPKQSCLQQSANLPCRPVSPSLHTFRPRANSLQATKICLARHTLLEDSAKELKGQAINLQAADSHAQPSSPAFKTPQTHNKQTKIPQRQKTGRHLPSGAPVLFPE